MILRYNKIIAENKKYLFWLAYVMYLAELLFFSSMYGELDSLQMIFAGVRNISYLLICTKILLDFVYGKYSKRECALIIVITALMILSAKSAGNKSMLIYWTFIVAARDIELEEIVKAAIMIHLCCMLIIIASCVGGIIEDRVYMQGVDRNRLSLGYQYTTDSSNYFFHIILMYIYIKRDKISWESIGVLTLCNILLFKLTDTKSAFLLGIFALFVATIMKIFRSMRNNNVIYKAGAVLVVPVMSGIMICLSSFCDGKIQWLTSLDKILNGRLTLGYNAFNTYGIHFWGKSIQWIGGTRDYIENSGEYNYVDSSYIQILLSYGVVFFLFVCLLFIVLGWKAAKMNDIYLIMILSVIAIHSAFDPQLLWMAFNPFIMCYSYLRKKDLVLL